jgi:signal transduction histidine kinase
VKALAHFARALPSTLTGRVLLIIFAGLVVAHVASIAFFEIERARAIDRFAATDIAGRIVDYARLPISSSPRFVPRSRLRWQEVETLPAQPTEAAEPRAVFTSELRRLLAENFGGDPVAWTSSRDAPRPEGPAPSRAPDSGPRPDRPPDAGPRPDRPPDAGPRPDRPADAFPRADRPPGGGFHAGGPGGADRNAKLITVALKLPGGRNAVAEALLFQPSMQIPAEAWVSVALIFIVTLLFSIVAVRLAVQPVRMLADAADRLSRNIDEAPLPEKGAVEIRAATRAFNRMQDRLKRHVNSRALAFAAMSHDLRTPLTRMRLRLESLSEEAKERLGGDLQEIENLTRSVLEVTRGLSPEEAMVPLDIDQVLDRLVHDYAALGERIAFKGSAKPLEARPVALRRALGNLIDNALKYGKDVTVEIEDSGDHVQISVCDHGPGIPAEDLQKVVYPFYRVEGSRNRDTGGAGLGLAIAKDIVEGHGGELILQNRPYGGLRATILLPRRSH